MNDKMIVCPPEDTQKPAKSTARKKRNTKTIIWIAVVVELILAVILGRFLFKNSYERNKTKTVEDIRNAAYKTVYDATEKANHVSNKVTITLEGIREKADLEVLQVDASYVYTSDEEDKSRGHTIWYRIPGTGYFTVDMRMTEFIVDNERQHVLVRAPEPTITKFNENYEKIEELLFKGKTLVANGSIREGEEIAQKMVVRARIRMLKSLDTNISYYQAAKDSAKRLITNMIKALNPDMPNISVTVVFGNESVL